MQKRLSCLLMLFLMLFIKADVFHLPQKISIWEGFERDPNRRVSSAPYLSGDTFRAFCDHVLDETKTFLDVDKIKAGDTIFVVADFLLYFFRDMYPYIKHPFILVSHNRDDSIPGEFTSYLDDNKIVAWFAVNIDCMHEKLHAIPIGLANGYWTHGSLNVIERCTTSEQIEKTMFLCATYVAPTHASRQQVYAYFRKTSYCSFLKKKTWGQYLLALRTSKFVLSPRGNGMDCHRTWEALYMNAIPIVPSTTIDSVYADLPVIIMKDLTMLTENFLEQTWNEYSKRTFKKEKLYADYWFALISQYAESVRGY